MPTSVKPPRPTSYARIAPEGAKTSSFRPDVQGLRAVAVVAVILDHLLAWPPGGFVGVDIFFVISGFLITGLLLREQATTGTISFLGFYRRRLRRIFPAATIVLVASVAGGWFVFNTSRAVQTFGDAVAAFFFVANWRFAGAGTNYFEADGPTSPLQHFWSLAVEEQFYLVWPWLMLLIFWFLLRGRNGSEGIARAHRVIGIAMICITAGSFGWALWETQTSATTSYFSTISRVWELGAGALVAVYAEPLRRIPAGTRAVLAWVGLAGIGLSFYLVNEAVAFPAPWAALPVISAVLVIAAGTGGVPRSLRLLTNKVSTYIGDISYSLYLWHFPVIIIGTALLGDAPVMQVGFAAVFVLASVYTFHLVEDPIRRSKWLEPRRAPGRVASRRTGPTTSRGYALGALSLLALVTTSLVALALVHAPGTRTLPRAAPVAVDLAGGTENESKTPEADKLQAELASALQATDWPDLDPALDQVIGGPATPVDVSSCSVPNIDVEQCTWGDPEATHSIVMVGNSISMSFVDGVRGAIGSSGGWRVTSLGMFGCPFESGAELAKLVDLPKGCTERADVAMQVIDQMKPEVVILSGVVSSTGAAVEVARMPEGVKLVYLPGPPTSSNVEECYTKVSHPADCIGTLPSWWAEGESDLAGSLKRPGTFVDTHAWFCYQGSCPAFAGGIPIKFDEAHITPAYSQRLNPVIREAFEALGILSTE